MCLAVPVKVSKIEGQNAFVELGGLSRQANITLVPDVKVGDYVLLHAGFAIERLDEEEAEETLRIFAEMAEAEQEIIQSTQGEAG